VKIGGRPYEGDPYREIRCRRAPRQREKSASPPRMGRGQLVPRGRQLWSNTRLEDRQLGADTGPSSGADQLAEAFDLSQPFAVAGASPTGPKNRSGRVLSPNPSTSRCKICVVWEAVPRCEKQSFSANTIGDRNRWLHHCAPPAVSNRFGSCVHIGTRPDQQPKRKQASDHSQAAG
jgi:hypothetical protein